MKFNLKNLPDVYCEVLNETYDRCSKKDMEKLSDWIDGFEAELKKKKDFLVEHIKEHFIKGEQTVILEAYKTVIEEILGDET